MTSIVASRFFQSDSYACHSNRMGPELFSAQSTGMVFDMEVR